MAQRVVGAVLAGGRSLRMGTDKAAVVVDGAPMSLLVRQALGAVCDEVLVVGGVGADVFDDGDGPLIAVVALLRSGRGTHFVIAATDQPRLAPQVLQPLLDAHGDDDNGVAWEGEPLPLCISISALPRLEAAIAAGERRLRAAVTVWLPVTSIAVRAGLIDVDTPDPPSRRV